MTRARRIRFAVLLSAFLALHGSLGAATFRFLPWDDAVAARKIGLRDGKGVTELEDLHPLKRSKAVNAAAGETPPVLVALDRKSPDGKEVTVELKMAADLQSPLVLIIPDPKHPAGLRTFVIEDNSAKFPWGSLRLLNATGKALLVRYEKTVTALPNSWTPVDIVPGGKARNVSVQLAARDNTKAILYSAVWEHDPDVRELAFIVPSAEAGALDLKIIPENRRGLAPAPAAANP